MSNIPKLTQMDKMDLCDITSTAIQFTIENWHLIMFIASYLTNGNPSAAFRDILEKGISELNILCGLDQEATEAGL